MELEDFIPRDYQVELYQSALEEDTIVYLPTGSGKTFIAVLLIKAKAHEVVLPLSHGGKRTIFLVPTVVLAIQQANYLRRHTHLKVKEFYGSLGVDLWTSNRWQIEFENNHVLVMTAQIFVDILNHGFQSVNKINLIIFDECHAATKDAPMRQVFLKLDQFETSERPRVLGLTAALFRKRVKPHQVHSIINKLTETMRCVVKLPKDIKDVYRNSTKPCELIIEYRDPESTEWHPEVIKLIASIKIRTEKMTEKLQQSLCSMNAGGGDPTTMKTDVLFTSLKETIHLLQTFGPYAAIHISVVYYKFMRKQKSQAKSREMSCLLQLCCDFFKDIQNICSACFDQFPKRDQLMKFINPQVTRLLELLKRFAPEDGSEESRQSFQLSSIIFVERRSTANMLYHFLQDVSQNHPDFSYLKPLFTMGQATKSTNLKEVSILNMKQKEIVDNFRRGTCNLLVSTSVLEEGVDIPACNLIVKFDPIKTFCDYVQSKGRARARKAFYCVMVSQKDRDANNDMLLQFHSIEQQLYNNRFENYDSRIDRIFDGLVPPYSPFGINGPQVTMQSSISLVNRYCGKLTSRYGLMDIVAPKWILTEIAESDIDDIEWLTEIEATLYKSEMSVEIPVMFQCQINLPLNSPLRDVVTGKAMPSKRLAKSSAALQLCIRLHQMKELDDEHLLPINQEDLESEFDEDDTGDNDGPNETKGEQFYRRHYPAVSRNCLPRCGTTCFVYAIRFRSEGGEPLPVKLGILSSVIIPDVCQFPLITRSGEYLVEICGVDCITLDEMQIDCLFQFHRFLFEEVIFLFKQKLCSNVDDPHLQYTITPMTTEGVIDFAFAQKIISAPKVDWDRVPTETFTFHVERYVDAVVVPWYQPFGKFLPYYVDAISELTVLSDFPDKSYIDYRTYFHKKFGVDISDSNQSLLECSREITGKHFLLPRVMSAGNKETRLVPELVHLHALPASVWKQVVWIPSILHRLNGLLVAEELRLNLVRGANIGVEFPPNNLNGSDIWKPLKVKKTAASSPRASSNIFVPINSVQQISLSRRKLNLYADSLWNFDAFDDIPPSPTSDESSPDVSIDSDGFNSRIVTPVDSNSEVYLSFDEPNPREYSEYGPSPGYILEALTMTRADEGFSLERLETIGDSFLKLAASIIVYGKSDTRNFNEGHLTRMRSSRICNQYLFQLGSKINLGEMLSAHRFDLGANFLPPCYQVPSIQTNPNCYLEQNGISRKNIADSVEALIGVYLLTSGIKGALTFLNFIGLKTFTEGDENYKVNPVNGFPIMSFLPLIHPPDDEQEMFAHLFAGLESLEARIRYTFKNKALLVEALTHASFYPNRVTNCFQRLEFLGDAVLDYLVTRYYYDDPLEYSPAVLTDLRSATVNNEMFAVLSVRNGFHLYLKHMSVTVNNLLDQFVRIQEENGHKTMQNHFDLVCIDGYTYASNVEVPKVLGDIFESVAGAIFIDSGMSLDAVWQSYSPFLLEEIEKFHSNIPKSPVRILYEKFKAGQIKFESSTMEDDQLCISISIEGIKDVFKGIGRNTRFAKNAAAKYALYKMRET